MIPYLLGQFPFWVISIDNAEEEKEKFQYSLDLENSDFFISAEIYEDASDEEQFSGLIDDAEYLEKVMDWFFERSDLPNSIQQLVSAENTGEWDAYNYESIESNENTTLTLNKSKYNLAYHFNAYTNVKQFVINSVSKEDKSGIGIAYCEKMSESVYDYFVVIYSNENMNAGYSFYLVKEKQFYPVSTESALACCTKTESEAGDEVDKINNISASEQHD